MYKLHVKIFRWNKDKGSDIRRLYEYNLRDAHDWDVSSQVRVDRSAKMLFSSQKGVHMHVVQILTQHTPDFRTHLVLYYYMQKRVRLIMRTKMQHPVSQWALAENENDERHERWSSPGSKR